MSIVDVLSAAVFGIGSFLLLERAPWVRRRPTIGRLQPYSRHPDAHRNSRSPEAPIRQVLEPLFATWGARASHLLGVATDLNTRLARAHSPLDAYAFRLRQLTWALVTLCCSALFVLQLSLPPIVALFVLTGSPILAVLVLEQKLSAAIRDRQQRLQAELPVVIEQLGMLLSSGYSLSSAIGRLSARGSGAVAEDLHQVLLAIRQGVPESTAFQRWAELTGLESVSRLVRVLGLHSEAGNLGHLISDEARSIRAEAHRELLEAIEKRAQLVWIPVTVATLVPGLIFLAVPFYSAMSQVTG